MAVVCSLLMPSVDDFKDYYEILGVSPGASQEEIKKAWKKKMRQFHPDRFANADEETKEYANEMAKLINEAYHVLKDPEEREKYDIRMGYKKPPSAPVVTPGPSVPVYGAQHQGMVYSGAQPSAGSHVYEVIDISPSDEVIIEEIFEEPVAEAQTVVEKPAIQERKKKPARRTVEKKDYTLHIFAIGSIISIIVLILVLPFIFPGMPSILPTGSGEESSHEEKIVDSDRDGVPDSMDIYPHGNGVVCVTITYFKVVNNPGDEKINPYFRVNIDGHDLPNSTIYYGEDTISQPVGPFTWDIPDNAASVTLLVAAYSFSSTGDDQLIDIDPSPFYNRYDRISTSELVKGPVIRNWDGTEDGESEELDAIIIYRVEIRGEEVG